MLIALILAMVPIQDDLSKWVDRLDSDSIEEREEAARRLQAMGTEAVARLEKARDGAGHPELRARIETILSNIRKGAELAKVFGPTRRVTVAARGRPLKEILSDLKAPRIKIVAGALDEEARVDLQVRNVTWWEALDRAARAAKARYVISWNDDATYTVELKRGPEPENPVFYLEQFRISVAESKRFDFRSPSGRIEGALVAIEVRHQADLQVPFADSEEFVRVESVLDAKGADAKVEPPEDRVWTSDAPLLLSCQAHAWIRPTAALPLTVCGTTNIPFACDTRQVELDLEGDRSRVKVGKAVIQVAKFQQTKSGLHVTLQADAEETPFLYERLDSFSVVLIDGEGRKHEGTADSSWSGETSCRWDVTFSTGIEKPRRVVVPWIAEFHQVRIPFRLEGVRLPDLK